MKRNQLKYKTPLEKFAFVLGSTAVLAAGIRAHAATVADFTFDTLTFGTAASFTGKTVGGILADIGLGTASAVHASASTVYSTPSGNGSAKAFSSNVWANGDYYQFNIDSTSYTGLTLSFDEFRSSTGPAGFSLLYSTDAGASFLTFGSIAPLAAPAWSTSTYQSLFTYTFDLSGISAANNNTGLEFRLASNGLNSAGTTIATTGTDRVDNFLVTTAVPEPSVSGLAIASLAGVAIAMRNRRRRA